MSATNTLETGLLALLFNGTAIANLALNASASPATSLYLSLHTADPGEAGDQSSSETNYTGYGRVAVTRDSSGWTVSGNSASNTGTVTFGKCTAGPQTLTHVGVGLSSSGTGTLLLSAALNSSLVLAIGATPLFAASQCAFTAD